MVTMSGIPNLKHQGVCLDSLEGASSKEELLRSQLFVPSGTTEAAEARLSVLKLQAAHSLSRGRDGQESGEEQGLWPNGGTDILFLMF